MKRNTAERFFTKPSEFRESAYWCQGQNDRLTAIFADIEDQSSFDHYMDLKFYLEDNFNCPVDLVLNDSVKPRLRQIVKREVAYA